MQGREEEDIRFTHLAEQFILRKPPQPFDLSIHPQAFGELTQTGFVVSRSADQEPPPR